MDCRSLAREMQKKAGEQAVRVELERDSRGISMSYYGTAARYRLNMMAPSFLCLARNGHGWSVKVRDEDILHLHHASL